jgi:hypothetical protein
MTDTRNQLLLAAMQRAGKPLTSGDVLDEATGLAEAEGWQAQHLADVTRKSVSKRLQNMATGSTPLVLVAGSALDEASRRMTPTYAPAAGYDVHAPIPPPPAAPPARANTPFDGLTTVQSVTLLDVQDELLAVFGRQMQSMQRQMSDMERFFAELAATREKSRQRLLAVGLGDR